MAPKFVILPDGKRLDLPDLDKREVGPVGTILSGIALFVGLYAVAVLFFSL